VSDDHMLLKRTTWAMVHAVVQRAALILLGAWMVTACDQISPPPVPPPRPAAATAQASRGAATQQTVQLAVPPCHQPIEKACDAEGCATYDVAAARVKAAAKKLGELGFFSGAGTCGDLRSLHQGYGVGSETSYFDASGNMVAAAHATGAFDDKCKGLFTYGLEVRCEDVLVAGYGGEPAPAPPVRREP
jgi:hypothetical protein